MMQRFRYTGPVTGFTYTTTDGVRVDQMLHDGGEVVLTAEAREHPVVKRLRSAGRLELLFEFAPVTPAIAPAKKSEKSDRARGSAAASSTASTNSVPSAPSTEVSR